MIKFNKFFLLLLICLSALSSCISYKASYNGRWEMYDDKSIPYYTVFLIGDAGNVGIGDSSIVFDHLKEELDKQDSNSTIVWLGDNIYPIGLAPESSIYYAQGRHRLQAQLNTMSDYRGNKYFVPGNHDWYTYGRVGLRRQELLIDSFLSSTPNINNQNNYFIPDKGCGDPQVFSLNNDISLLLMDSHWFLNDRAKANDQSACNVKTSKEYLDKLKSAVEYSNDKSLIVASHHPPYTYAHHGGKFPLKDYIFPFTQKVKWLYLPLPFSGIVFNKVRLRISEQDVYHPNYITYKNSLNKILKNKGRSIVASGHEHTLQFIENNNQYYIVSGAGTKNNKVGMGKGSKFAIGEQGYVKILFKDKNHALVQYIVPGQFGNNSNIAYEKKIILQ